MLVRFLNSITTTSPGVALQQVEVQSGRKVCAVMLPRTNLVDAHFSVQQVNRRMAETKVRQTLIDLSPVSSHLFDQCHPRCYCWGTVVQAKQLS